MKLKQVKLYKEPKLEEPYLLAAWPGMGMVALRAFSYLNRKLNAEEFGEIEPYDFFDPEVSIRDGLIDVPEFPENKLFYWKNEKGNDLMFCIGNEQPSPENEYKLADKIVDVAKHFRVKRVYTSAAFALGGHLLGERRVFGVVTDRESKQYLKKHRVMLLSEAMQMKEAGISGMNGVILGAARERCIGGICLFGEMPEAEVRLPYSKTSKVVCDTLIRILELKVDTQELEEEITQGIKELEQQSLRYTVDYKDLFGKGGKTNEH
ncbi:MAG: PAC2 family protein [Candidatus Aenigmarchaeota archaeon]|nr:PAC2 family protein [Candidatus Aenigmarchaeota archaeon]